MAKTKVETADLLVRTRRSNGFTARISRAASSTVYPLATMLGLLMLWELVIIVFKVPPFILPTPRDVFMTTVQEIGLLLRHSQATLTIILVGYFSAVAIGLPLAVLMVSWRPVERVLNPLLVSSQAVPKVAIAPLLVVWLGFGDAPKIIVTVLVTIFPIVISSVVGLKSISPQMIHLGRSMGLSWLKMFIKIRIPNALPSCFGGLKVGITLAIVGAIVGEFVGSNYGLGYLLIMSIGQMRINLMFASLVGLVIMAIILYAALELVEKLSIPWHIRSTAQGTPAERGDAT